ncbi:MAG: hypothetical protein PHD57_04990 [Desulfobacterales bacterium]|nr:hypothetical protein [Desulfobacterales bacterium]MDD3950959.1 hypothetical protein [Desulfobacterales bacterium]
MPEKQFDFAAADRVTNYVLWLTDALGMFQFSGKLHSGADLWQRFILMTGRARRSWNK